MWMDGLGGSHGLFPPSTHEALRKELRGYENEVPTQDQPLEISTKSPSFYFSLSFLST